VTSPAATHYLTTLSSAGGGVVGGALAAWQRNGTSAMAYYAALA